MTTHPTPIFIFSLPRSGSTITQRVLATHRQISTVSETWLLLPYLYTLKDRGVCAEYSHYNMSIAIADFCKELPNGVEDYLAEMRWFILRLYAKASKNNEKYVLDKTPRYHLVVEDIIRLFPEGKFIFLNRNPLAVVASMIEVWGGGRWNLYHYKVDLFDGFVNLAVAYQKYDKRACFVRYEDLMCNPTEEWKRVFDYLNLTFYPEKLLQFNEVELRGRMQGDIFGMKQYQTLSKEPLDKWKRILANPIRKAWCRHYLRWIGDHRLSVMGYDLRKILAELDAVPCDLRFVGSDMFNMFYGVLYCALEPLILKHKVSTLPDWHRVHYHS